jgi:rod shape determining protein RodA
MAMVWQEAGRRSIADQVASVAWSTIILAALIGSIGVMTLYSVGGGSLEPWGMRHALRLLLGFGMVLLMTAIPLRYWLAAAFPMYALGLISVLAVLSHGTQALGAQRWLDLGPVSFQPSEIMKAGLILALARVYQMLPIDRLSHARSVIVPLILILLPMALILKQPDLGTGLLLASIGIGMMFLGGTSLRWFAGGFAGLLAAAPFAWHYLHDYQKKRILVFLDPDVDPLGKGYQIFQSKIALGSGGYSGKGLLQGTQSQLDFVPEKQTDFIFTMFAEEMGFVGCIILMVLFLLLIWSLMLIALRCRSVFGRLLAGGVALSLFVHVFVNIAMVMGVAPVVGVPLPLVSYGGTSMVATLFGIGLALSAHRDRELLIDRKNIGWLV